MSRTLSALLLMIALASGAAAQDEMVANPFYKFWAGSKPGSTTSLLEVTKLGEQEGKGAPDGMDEKQITYKLVKVDDKQVVVEMVVTERDFLGYVQAAPTRYIYPAQLKKAHLERLLQETGAKTGEDSLKYKGKDVKCKTIAGTVKAPGGEQTEYKLWLSEDVPGQIVKHVRTTRRKDDQGNRTVAETTTTLQAYQKAE